MLKFIKPILLFFLLFSTLSYSQFTEFHPELKWYTIKGKHCRVYFHNGTERTARVVAKIADEVIGPLISLYDYDPGTINYVIKDMDDYSNGATYFFDNKIEIWTSALDFDLRGSHDWLRNVITHETTHMVQIQSAMKLTRTVPAIFLQELNYENERRPDILYGYPNVVASYPIATVNIPSWFAEGTAQYQRKEFHYDDWDTHRDMVLRCYALKGNMLTWNQMGEFDKTSLGDESVYNAGFSLTRYISQKYGEDKLEKISHDLGKWDVFTIDAAFKDVLGKDGNQIYKEWKDYVTASYRKRSVKVLSNLVEGDEICSTGFGNFYPNFSPNDKKFVYISNKHADYLGLSNAYLYDLKTKKEKLLADGVSTSISWIPGQNKLIYSKLSDENPNWYNIHDLYVYDMDKNKETRLTYDLRANQPFVSHSGKKIVFLFERDGTTNLATVDINGKNFKQLTSFKNGEQVYDPKFSNDDSYIIFGYAYTAGRSIARIDTNGKNFQFVIRSKCDNRNPVIAPNGNLIYCSDSTGIFNIYSYNMKTGVKKQLTNVLGGAFMPSIDKNGNILYAGYTSTGFKIFKITPEQQAKVIPADSYEWLNDPPLGKDKPKGDLKNFDMAKLIHYDDKITPNYKIKPYSGIFTKMTFYPFIRFDNYNTTNNFFEKIKPGVYLSSSDMLDRYSLFAGADLNSRMEYDLFLILNYRNKIPYLFDLGIRPELSIELYNISRKTNTSVGFASDTVDNQVSYVYSVPTSVSYNLLEFDFAAKQMILARNSYLEFRYIYSTYTANVGSFLIPGYYPPTLNPATNDTYFIGNNFQLKYTYDVIKSTKDEVINPIGFNFGLQYNYELNKFNPDGNYSVNNGMLQPVYNNYNFSSLELNTQIHFPIFTKQTLTTRLRLASIIGPILPDFFDYYLGGMPGMKAYPFYAIGGNHVAWFNLTYRFPLFTDIDTRIGQIYLDKIYMSVYGDVGNAWNYKSPLNDIKKGAGTEIRVHMVSFYEFPTDLFFDAAYGFDKFTTEFRGVPVTYGKEWRFYGGLLFGFDI